MKQNQYPGYQFSAKISRILSMIFLITATTIQAQNCFSVAQLTSTDACFGQSNGTAQFKVSLTGGCTCAPIGKINCLLIDGATIYAQSFTSPAFPLTVNMTDMQPGEYDLKLIGDDVDPGCAHSINGFVTIGTFSQMTLNFSSIQPSDCNGATGEFTVSVSGGDPNFSLSISPQTIPAQTFSGVGAGVPKTFSNLAAGNYNVQATDNNGCTTISMLTVPGQAAFDVTFSHTNVKCREGHDGEITFTTPTPTTGFMYSFSIAPGNSFTNLAAGTYSVTVTQTPGNCQKDTTITITQPASVLSLSVDPQPVSCLGRHDGQITANPSGGTHITGYKYLWSTTATTKIINGLDPANDYAVTVTDDNGCTAEQKNIEVQDAPSVNFDLVADTIINSGDNVEIKILNANNAYNYNWSVIDALNIAGLPPLIYGSVNFQGTIIRKTDLAGNRAPGILAYEISPVKINDATCLGTPRQISITIRPNADDVPFIPAIYTPNGDGANDEWHIILPAEATGTVTLFNRSGGKVYEGDANAPWNGNGCPDGPYFYVLQYTQAGQEKVVKGAVTILRTSE